MWTITTNDLTKANYDVAQISNEIFRKVIAAEGTTVDQAALVNHLMDSLEANHELAGLAPKQVAMAGFLLGFHYSRLLARNIVQYEGVNIGLSKDQ